MAVLLEDPVAAVIVTLTVATVLLVVMAKLAAVEPADTRIMLGTWATGLELLRNTMTPPAGAALASVTIPFDEPVRPIPPTTVAGFKVRLVIAGTATDTGVRSTT